MTSKKWSKRYGGYPNRLAPLFPCSPLGLVVGVCRAPGGDKLLKALLLLDIIQLTATDDRAMSYR